MKRINVIGIESIHGLKTIELMLGDVTDINCDLLAVSAFRNGYQATPGTVIGALKARHGFSLEGSFNACEFDLRDQFGIWVTQALNGYPFQRIICVEMVGRTNDLSAAIENLYVGLAILEAKGVRVRTLAMPFLGTGNQSIDPEAIVPHFISHTTSAIHRSSCLERVVFVANSAESATLISNEIDRQLGYSRTNLPRKELVGALLSELGILANKLSQETSGLQQKMAMELLSLVTQKEPLSTEIGLVARRLAEVVTDSLFKGKSDNDLFMKIESLGQLGISPWVVSYLHTLRIIGNEVVHIRERSSRKPQNLAEEDVALCLFCIVRVTRLWSDWVNAKP